MVGFTRRQLGIGVVAAGFAAIVAVGAVGAVVATLLASALPRDAGSARVPGLAAEVRVERDASGVPRVFAASITDALRAQGFVHAQDRYFQMDLSRRSAAGEVAALVGDAAVAYDAAQRANRLRDVAAAVVDRLPARHRVWLEAYTQGVNAGLADLGTRPPEYWLFGVPQPWAIEDSVLVVLALYATLASHQGYERPLAVMEAALPPDVVEFLTPRTSRFDSPLVHGVDDPTGGYRPSALPADVSVGAWAPGAQRRIVALPPMPLGSNQWAASGQRTTSGRALLANDPHLEHRLPNTFHRIELLWTGGEARGVGLPGVPGVVIGATAGVAWGVTVSYADQSDWVVIDTAGAPPGEYVVPEGTEPFEITREQIAVRGGEARTVEVRSTRWGPVTGEDGLGRPLALKATWLGADGLDLALLDLLDARTVDDGLNVVGAWRGPSLSWLFADTEGRIGWSVNGPLPQRQGFDGSAPRAWTSHGTGWVGLAMPPRHGPTREGVLAAANNRLLPLGAAQHIAHTPMPPFRAARIATRLAEHMAHDEQSFAALQLDSRAEAYDIVREIALEVIEEHDEDATLRVLRERFANWSGFAAADDLSFVHVRAGYVGLLEATLAPLLTPAVELDPAFVYRWPLADEAMRRVLDERPQAWLPAGHENWRAYLRAVLRASVASAEPPLSAQRWGESNRLTVSHPLASLPGVGRWLELPRVEQPGSSISVRVATPTRGAVMRMVVSPGAAHNGVLQLAGGQSGHPLSAHFDDQFPAWAAGAPAPFLAGDTATVFRLLPAGEAD